MFVLFSVLHFYLHPLFVCCSYVVIVLLCVCVFVLLGSMSAGLDNYIFV